MFLLCKCEVSSVRKIIRILKDQNCTAPEEIECWTGACFIAQASDGFQSRGCSKGDGITARIANTSVAFVVLTDHDKKCRKVHSNGTERDFCICNYDGCNDSLENSANPTSLASLTPLTSLILALAFNL